MRRAGSKRGGGAAGAGPAARANDALIDSGIATLERATSMDRLGQLEGGPGTTAYSSSSTRRDVVIRAFMASLLVYPIAA